MLSVNVHFNMFNGLWGARDMSQGAGWPGAAGVIMTATILVDSPFLPFPAKVIATVLCVLPLFFSVKPLRFVICHCALNSLDLNNIKYIVCNINLV